MSEYKIKPYEELDITDNFMFVKVFSNVDVAKDFLQDVLKISIEKITVVTEATTQEDPFHKSVRFDVLAREEIPSADGKANAGRQFDIEMQVENTGELPKRARYYQGMCDLDALAKGGDYEELQEQYILFICPDDIFHKGKSIYRFQNRDESDHEILLNDLCYKNFYIFNKYANIKDEATREYMQYFATKKCESKKMERIHELVEKYRKDPAAKKAYMTLEQELNIREKRTRAEERKILAKGFRDAGISLEVIAQQTGLSPEEIKAL
ncbi:MAG: Rpn family recombination-promoting nuclease/putative transposase [Fibrobacter sp.]|nr:Rpn family recombination-promoting nuclease/putative transposase [Fibrobacter sp.]